MTYTTDPVDWSDDAPWGGRVHIGAYVDAEPEEADQ